MKQTRKGFKMDDYIVVTPLGGKQYLGYIINTSPDHPGYLWVTRLAFYGDGPKLNIVTPQDAWRPATGADFHKFRVSCPTYLESAPMSYEDRPMSDDDWAEYQNL
jgi:hypothetical protein